MILCRCVYLDTTGIVWNSGDVMSRTARRRVSEFQDESLCSRTHRELKFTPDCACPCSGNFHANCHALPFFSRRGTLPRAPFERQFSAVT